MASKLSKYSRRRNYETVHIAFAYKALVDIRRRRAEYEEDCREWARQGYAPHYCIHGTNLWVDYDNICGPCEDSLSDIQVALEIGRGVWAEFEMRLDLIMKSHSIPNYPEEVKSVIRKEYAEFWNANTAPQHHIEIIP